MNATELMRQADIKQQNNLKQLLALDLSRGGRSLGRENDTNIITGER